MAVKKDEEILDTTENVVEEAALPKKSTAINPALKEFAKAVSFGQYGTGETLDKAIKDNGFKKSDVMNAVSKLTAK